MNNLRHYNPFYTRKWTKIFVPISTIFIQLGRKLGFESTTNSDETTIPLNEISYKNSPSFFSRLTSLIRYNSEPSKSNKKRLNGVTNENENPTIYHQIDIHRINDENNNENSTYINIPNDIYFNINQYRTTFCSTLKENLFPIVLFSFLYFLWFIFIAGISIVHVIIYSALLLSYLISDRTRRFTLAILIYLMYLLLYDALHLVPNYTISKIHIEDIYLIEKKFFGIYQNGHLMTLNEYFQQNHKPILDVFTGFCYLNWIPIPVTYSLYLYRYKTKRDYIDFAFTFLLTNILGFIVYYIIPAAPPWYIEKYGFEFNINAAGNPAGFKDFDQITGLKVFSSIYSKNANVFAAIPSLHAAYPLITVLYGSLSKKLWLHIGFVLFTLSVWFSAVYSRHHYVLDVLAGGLCALTAYIIYRLLSRIPTINRLLVGYSKLI